VDRKKTNPDNVNVAPYTAKQVNFHEGGKLYKNGPGFTSSKTALMSLDKNGQATASRQ